MLAHEYETMRRLEDRYWWYRILRGMTCREAEAQAARIGTSRIRILDAGCGTGGTMEALRGRSREWRLQGLDRSEIALDHARRRGFDELWAGTVDSISCESGSQDMVISLDVLCCGGFEPAHAMREFRRVLAPQGRLVMNVPAFACLRGRHDSAVRNVRRFTAREVRELHDHAGFDVECLFCWNAWLFLPVLLWRRASRMMATASSDAAVSDLAPTPVAVNTLLTVVGGWDAAMCRLIGSPIGTSIFSVARAARTD